ncbi:MAG TPA: hypothetical protein VGK47_04545 [Nitrososphaeraceae archaeon]
MNKTRFSTKSSDDKINQCLWYALMSAQRFLFDHHGDKSTFNDNGEDVLMDYKKELRAMIDWIVGRPAFTRLGIAVGHFYPVEPFDFENCEEVACNFCGEKEVSDED